MNLKTWQAALAAAVSVIALMGAIGFMAPGSRAEKNEKAIVEVRSEIKAEHEKNASQDVDIATMKKDIEFTARGVDALLQKEGLTPAPRRRR